MKFAVTRLRGHTNELRASINGLPPGVSVVSTTIPPGNASVVLKLAAAADAAPFNGPVEVVLEDRASHLTRPVPFGDEEARALHAFAGLAATAIARARFADEARKARDIRASFERFFAPGVAAAIAATRQRARRPSVH